MPITWKNVESRNNGGAGLMAVASNSFDKGVNALQGVLETNKENAVSQFEARKTSNDEKYKDYLSSFESTEALKAAQESGAVDAELANYGPMSRGLRREGDESRLTALTGQENVEYEREQQVIAREWAPLQDEFDALNQGNKDEERAQWLEKNQDAITRARKAGFLTDASQKQDQFELTQFRANQAHDRVEEAYRLKKVTDQAINTAAATANSGTQYLIDEAQRISESIPGVARNSVTGEVVAENEEARLQYEQQLAKSRSNQPDFSRQAQQQLHQKMVDAGASPGDIVVAMKNLHAVDAHQWGMAPEEKRKYDAEGAGREAAIANNSHFKVRDLSIDEKTQQALQIGMLGNGNLADILKSGNKNDAAEIHALMRSAFDGGVDGEMLTPTMVGQALAGMTREWDDWLGQLVELRTVDTDNDFAQALRDTITDSSKRETAEFKQYQVDKSEWIKRGASSRDTRQVDQLYANVNDAKGNTLSDQQNIKKANIEGRLSPLYKGIADNRVERPPPVDKVSLNQAMAKSGESVLQAAAQKAEAKASAAIKPYQSPKADPNAPVNEDLPDMNAPNSGPRKVKEPVTWATVQKNPTEDNVFEYAKDLPKGQIRQTFRRFDGLSAAKLAKVEKRILKYKKDKRDNRETIGDGVSDIWELAQRKLRRVNQSRNVTKEEISNSQILKDLVATNQDVRMR
jgi:hypothetical protein